MCQILQMPARDTREGRPAQRDRSAEIVIFPGVQIERREFNLTDRRAVAVRSASAPAPQDES